MENIYDKSSKKAFSTSFLINCFDGLQKPYQEDASTSLLREAATEYKKEGTYLDYFSCVSKPQINSKISVLSLLMEIREGTSVYIKDIEKARLVGKGTEEYDKIKKKLPAVSWQFSFDGYKKDENIIGSTGYLYFDIDSNDFKPEIHLNKNDVFSYFRSLSNSGYSIITQVEGVTKENFKETYLEIANELGIEIWIDKNAIRKSQYTIISFDPKIHINTDSRIFKAKDKKVQLGVLKEYNKYKQPLGELTAPFYRISNRDELVDITSFASNKDGFSLIQVTIPSKIKRGSTHRTIAAITQNLVYLNPKLSFKEILDWVSLKNSKRCEQPLPEIELRLLVEYIFDLKNKGTLTPSIFKKKGKKKKILFGYESGLDVKDKQSISAKEIAVWKSEKTKKKINEAIENNQHKKITINSISEYSGVSVRTIKNYWFEFKDIVHSINKQF